jgi:hypothetical protein
MNCIFKHTVEVVSTALMTELLPLPASSFVVVFPIPSNIHIHIHEYQFLISILV